MTAAKLPIWMIVPLEATRRGLKAWHMTMTAKTFVAKVSSTSEMSISRAGMV